MNYKKLLGIATAVTTIAGYTFTFSNYASKDSWIKEGIDRIKGVALGYRAQLDEMRNRYNSLLADLDSTANALAKAEAKLKQVYEAITGEAWNDENGSILSFDFSSILPDEPLPDNPIDGDILCEILGLPSGSSMEEIVASIEDLIEAVQSLEQRVEVLESQVASLQAEIDEYEAEQDSLVEQVNGLKDKLDNAVTEANSIIDNASQEEEAQLDYVNDTLTELGAEPVEEPKEEVTMTEEQQALWNTYIDAVNASNLNADWKSQLSDGTLYAIVEYQDGAQVFRMYNSSTGEMVKQYDSVNSEMKAVANAYQAYLASMNS